jgi:hypothetical protein
VKLFKKAVGQAYLSSMGRRLTEAARGDEKLCPALKHAA